jgi:hypothetical protein
MTYPREERRSFQRLIKPTFVPDQAAVRKGQGRVVSLGCLFR